jgi:hypothetical protein
MANVKISDLSNATTPLVGTEQFETVQGGVSLKTTSNDIASLAIKKVKVTLSSSEILALFTTPKVLIAAQGANTIINVISIAASLVYNSTPYATNTDIQFSINSLSNLATYSGFLANTSSQIKVSTITSSEGSTSGATNRSLKLISLSGNPTAGNSTLDIYITYNVISL